MPFPFQVLSTFVEQRSWVITNPKDALFQGKSLNFNDFRTFALFDTPQKMDNLMQLKMHVYFDKNNPPYNEHVIIALFNSPT